MLYNLASFSSTVGLVPTSGGRWPGAHPHVDSPIDVGPALDDSPPLHWFTVKWKRTLLRPYQSLGTLYEMTGDHARAADARSKAYSTCSEPRGGVGAANVQWAVEAMVSFARAGMTKEAEEWRDVAREGWARSIGDTKLFNLFYGKVIAHYLP